MKQRKQPRVDLSSDLMGVDSTSIQDSFLWQQDVPKDFHSERPKINSGNKDDGYISEDEFILHCNTPTSCSSAITMDISSHHSRMESIPDAISLPSLSAMPTDEAIVGIADQIDITATSIRPKAEKEPFIFMEDDSFTYVTLEESKSSQCNGDWIHQSIANDANDMQLPQTAPLQTPYTTTGTTRSTFTFNTGSKTASKSRRINAMNLLQTPYTYQTIEDDGAANQTGLASQYTFVTIQTMGKENAAISRSNVTKTSSRRKRAVVDAMDLDYLNRSYL